MYLQDLHERQSEVEQQQQYFGGCSNIVNDIWALHLVFLWKTSAWWCWYAMAVVWCSSNGIRAIDGRFNIYLQHFCAQFHFFFVLPSLSLIRLPFVQCLSRMCVWMFACAFHSYKYINAKNIIYVRVQRISYFILFVVSYSRHRCFQINRHSLQSQWFARQINRKLFCHRTPLSYFIFCRNQHPPHYSHHDI